MKNLELISLLKEIIKPKEVDPATGKILSIEVEPKDKHDKKFDFDKDDVLTTPGRVRKQSFYKLRNGIKIFPCFEPIEQFYTDNKSHPSYQERKNIQNYYKNAKKVLDTLKTLDPSIYTNDVLEVLSKYFEPAFSSIADEIGTKNMYIIHLESEDRSARYLAEAAAKYFNTDKVYELKKIVYPDAGTAINFDKEDKLGGLSNIESIIKHINSRKSTDVLRISNVNDLENPNLLNLVEHILQFFSYTLEYVDDGKEVKENFKPGEFSVNDLKDLNLFPYSITYNSIKLSKKIYGLYLAKAQSKYAINPEKEYGQKKDKLASILSRSINVPLKAAFDGSNSNFIFVDDNTHSGMDFRLLFDTLLGMEQEKSDNDELPYRYEPLNNRIAGLVYYKLFPKFTK